MKSLKKAPLPGTLAKLSRFGWWRVGLVTAVSVGLLAGGAWWMNQAGWSPTVLLATLIPDGQHAPMYNPAGGLSQQDARLQYRQAVQLLKKDKDYSQALTLLDPLLQAMPGLADWVLYHQAEAYVGLGQEKKAQERLRMLTLKRPNSALRVSAAYQLAQSAYRTGNSDQARSQFEALRREFPESVYAIGALYYLGRLAADGENSSQAMQAAAPFWFEYLEKSPDGRFGTEVAQELSGAIQSPTPDQSRLIGLGLANGQQDWAKTIAYLKQAPLHAVWLELASAYLEQGNKTAALNAIMNGVGTETDRDRAKKGLDLLIKNSSKPVDALKRLYDSHPKERLVAGDYLLWQLAQLDSDNALLYYQILLKHYPDRDYAPESSWNLMWPALREGQTSAFLAKADRHLERYPHSRSASKALFWKAKLMERQGKTAEAIRHYEEILRRYPNVYYAFRAYGRLQALTHHRADPGWTTYPARSAQVYPPDARQMSLSILPADGEKHLEQAGKLSGEEARYRLAVAKELEATGVADDVALLFKESTGKVPASVASWQEALDGDRAKGMRTIRDDLDERFKTGYLPTENELKLLYPVYFSTPIARQAPANQLDPYLVQSLMREESYFNEFAVSGSNARGLMQLMPATAQEVAKTVGIPNFTIMTLFSPDTNIRLGCRYLGYLHKRFAGQSMPSVGAYNGGPNAMQRWIDKSSLYAQDPDMFVETIPYDQTRDYIKKVYTSYWNYQRLYNPQSPFVR